MVKKFESTVDRLYSKLDGLYHKYHIIFDILFYVCLVLFLIIAILAHAERSISTPVFFHALVKKMVLLMDYRLLPILAGCALLFDFKDKKARYIVFFSLYILMLYQIQAEKRIVAVIPHCSTYYLGVGCLATAAKGRDFKKMGWTYVLVHTALMLLFTGLALTGIVPDLTFQEQMRADRHSLGMTYPLHYAAHWLSIVIAYSYLKDGLFRWWDYVMTGIVLCVCVFLCKAQTTSILIFLVLAGTAYRQFGIPKTGKGLPIPYRILEFSYIIMAVGMTALSFLSAPFRTTLEHIPLLQTLNSRWNANQIGLRLYFPSALGVDCPYQGPNGEYFFDTSYVSILVRLGIVLFVIILFAQWHLLHRMSMEKQRYGLCLMALLAVSFAMEDRMLNLAINPFWLMVFADLSLKRVGSDGGEGRKKHG